MPCSEKAEPSALTPYLRRGLIRQLPAMKVWAGPGTAVEQHDVLALQHLQQPPHHQQRVLSKNAQNAASVSGLETFWTHPKPPPPPHMWVHARSAGPRGLSPSEADSRATGGAEESETSATATAATAAAGGLSESEPLCAHFGSQSQDAGAAVTGAVAACRGESAFRCTAFRRVPPLSACPSFCRLSPISVQAPGPGGRRLRLRLCSSRLPRRVCDSSRRAPRSRSHRARQSWGFRPCATEILHRWARTPEPARGRPGPKVRYARHRAALGLSSRQAERPPAVAVRKPVKSAGLHRLSGARLSSPIWNPPALRPRQEGWSKAQPAKFRFQPNKKKTPLANLASLGR